jgi:hypothetical protein
VDVPSIFSASTGRQCPRCKLENPPGAIKCDCGHDFRSGVRTGPPAERRAEPQFHSGQRPAAAANFCSRCGSRLTEGARFCEGCGAPVAPLLLGPQGNQGSEEPASTSKASEAVRGPLSREPAQFESASNSPSILYTILKSTAQILGAIVGGIALAIVIAYVMWDSGGTSRWSWQVKPPVPATPMPSAGAPQIKDYCEHGRNLALRAIRASLAKDEDERVRITTEITTIIKDERIAASDRARMAACVQEALQAVR